MLIWTRSQDDWFQDQKLFKSLQSVLQLPCITRESLVEAPSAPKSSLTVCTSPETAKRLVVTQDAVFCFGKKTYDTLKERGFSHIIYKPAICMEEALPELSSLQKTYTRLWLPGPAIRAYDLEQYAQSLGWTHERVDLYQTSYGYIATPDRVKTLNSLKQATLCVASPSAIEGFCQHTLPFSWQTWTICALGPTTEKACRLAGFQNIRTPEKQSLKGLVQLAENILLDHRQTERNT